MSNIRSKSARAKLERRREPYWQPLKAGQALGFRKMPDSGAESWVAKLRDPESGKRAYRALGELSDAFGYDDALAAAEAFFAERDAGVVISGPFTVANACREYVAELRREKRTAAADDAESRFKRGAIYGHEDDGSSLHKLRLGRIEVKKLRTPTIKKWRQLLDMGNAGANRMMTSLRAALNLAVENDKATTTAAQAWRKVKQHKKADGRRDLTLDKKQRQAMLDNCTGAVRNLVEAAIHTGCRPGELRALNRSDFNGRTGTLTVTGKTGRREVPLSPAAAAFFKRMSKGKLPAAPLLPKDDGEAWAYGERAIYAREIRAAATRAKLPPKVVLYTFRHSWITDALLGGMPTLEVSKLTGTSLQMIENNYGHLVQGAVRERLARLDML